MALHVDGVYIKSDKFNAGNQINEARFPGGPVPYPQWGASIRSRPLARRTTGRS